MKNFEEIPEVTEFVANEAGQIVSFALLNDIKIEIDYDVIGGVAIFLSNNIDENSVYVRDSKELWVSLLNDGTRTVLDLNNKNLISKSIDYKLILDFLFSD